MYVNFYFNQKLYGDHGPGTWIIYKFSTKMSEMWWTTKARPIIDIYGLFVVFYLGIKIE